MTMAKIRKLLPRLLTSSLLVFLAVTFCFGDDGKTSRAGTDCPPDDKSCVEDRVGYDHIALLHAMIDDDHDGSLNREESGEFIRQDLHHSASAASREKNLHRDDDSITVHDLWLIWVNSEVYNWTVLEVSDWLITIVELPQYDKAFRDNNIDGKVLPRLSATQTSLVNKLGIKNGVHRQKLMVKATDLVLFGPPKAPHNFKKDVALVVSLLIAVGGCYYAYTQQKAAQSHVKKLMKELGSLQNAEDALTQLQQQLDTAHKEQQTVINDKLTLERKLREEVEAARAEAESLRQHELSLGNKNGEANEELNKVRIALQEAERRLQETTGSLSLPELQHWLCRTYDIETKYFNEKRSGAESQLRAAKEMCDKIKKQKKQFLGSIRVAHTTSLDDTDSRIVQVRTALEDVKAELQERMSRWKQIEKICGFNIVNDGPGGFGLSSSKSRGSRDTLDEDSVSCASFSMTDSLRRRGTTMTGHSSGSSLRNAEGGGSTHSAESIRSNPSDPVLGGGASSGGGPVLGEKYRRFDVPDIVSG